MGNERCHRCDRAECKVEEIWRSMTGANAGSGPRIAEYDAAKLECMRNAVDWRARVEAAARIGSDDADIARDREVIFKSHYPTATIERQRTNGREVYFLIRKERGSYMPCGDGKTRSEAWNDAVRRSGLTGLKETP